MTTVTLGDGTKVSIPIPLADLEKLGEDVLDLLVVNRHPHARLNRLAGAGEVKALELILENSEYTKVVDAHGDDGFTPLFRVILKANPEHRLPLVKVLIAAGANPYVTQDFPAILSLYSSPFNHALQKQDTELFGYLLHSRHVDVERLYSFVENEELRATAQGRVLDVMRTVLQQHMKRVKPIPSTGSVTSTHK
ncbi:hypothetical protein [Longimicrobium terrae]|uniref:Ankyrin repeat protein n=1 Tax=Longimicrobium terrae TaxID=1639882 RepID=A0A841GS34_9BACT|nr:hypothetical protein [Longimicrobium terrae]MBB4635626.1 ankyrin repeat protein [Longimicrobium terrae]MBB6070020.1 ankyrin repeat protein [Longimicrobium terrae]NNC32929.1 hypothetical protein [Longimicrobium terrae]